MADYFSAIVQRLRAKMDVLPSLVPPWITVMNRPEALNQNQWDEEDNIPAIDPDEDESIVQPFDPAKIRVETRSMSLDLLLQRIEYKELDLAPDFQRKGGLWKPKAKSRLIESLLIRIPLPAFYMDATDEDRWSVIDGLQRLSILKSFVIDKIMRLEGMEFLSQLEGKNYEEIPRNFQRRILEAQVTVYLIEKGTPPEVKFNIFRRINTGGLPLTPQEIRHALYQGKATRLLKELAELPSFLEATTKSIPKDRMADREFVLRFLAFIVTDPEDYKSVEFDSFLGDTMKTINLFPDSRIEILKTQFEVAMLCSSILLGKHAFRKIYDEYSARLPINKALFEAWSVNLAKLTIDECSILEENKEILLGGFIQLMEHWKFANSISQGTGDPGRVKIRFKSIRLLIQYCLSEQIRAEKTFGDFIADFIGSEETLVEV
jgi:hypothetical protein